MVFSAIYLGTVPPQTRGWVLAALLAVVFVKETIWNTAVTRIFWLDRTRAGYISLKTLFDRSFGGSLALCRAKIAAT